jgi:hypothetical protein
VLVVVRSEGEVVPGVPLDVSTAVDVQAAARSAPAANRESLADMGEGGYRSVDM